MCEEGKPCPEIEGTAKLLIAMASSNILQQLTVGGLLRQMDERLQNSPTFKATVLILTKRTVDEIREALPDKGNDLADEKKDEIIVAVANIVAVAFGMGAASVKLLEEAGELSPPKPLIKPEDKAHQQATELFTTIMEKIEALKKRN